MPDATTQNRPLISKQRPELVGRAERSWSEPTILLEIFDELAQRKRKRAKKLQEKIAIRLLEFSKQSFKWPETAILPSTKALSGNHFSYKDGVLSFMGYHVGASGAWPNLRYRILDYVYNEQIPRVNDAAYMEEWGQPKTARRLLKMANCLAGLARQASRKQSADMTIAIDDWKSDLQYLETRYYEGRYDFTWPNSYRRSNSL